MSNTNQNKDTDQTPQPPAPQPQEPDTGQGAPGTSPQPQEPADSDEEPAGGNREAAKYRRQLRDAEAERDEALTLVSEARRELLASALRDVEHVTTTNIGQNKRVEHHGYLVPDAIDDAGVNLDAVFDGMTLNRDSLQTELARIHAAKPYLFKPGRLYIPSEGTQPDRDKGLRTGFESAFAPKPR